MPTAAVDATNRFDALARTGDLDAFSDVVAAGCIDNDPAPGQRLGPQGFKTFFSMMRNAFSDMKVEPETLVSEGDKAAFAYTLTSAHKDDFQGVSATGKSIEVRGMQIGRFKSGEMV